MDIWLEFQLAPVLSWQWVPLVKRITEHKQEAKACPVWLFVHTLLFSSSLSQVGPTARSIQGPVIHLSITPNSHSTPPLHLHRLSLTRNPWEKRRYKGRNRAASPRAARAAPTAANSRVGGAAMAVQDDRSSASWMVAVSVTMEAMNYVWISPAWSIIRSADLSVVGQLDRWMCRFCKGVPCRFRFSMVLLDWSMPLEHDSSCVIVGDYMVPHGLLWMIYATAWKK